MDERTGLLYRFQILRDECPEIDIPNNINNIQELQFRYTLALHQVHEYHKKQQIKNEVSRIHNASILCLEILHHKTVNYNLKKQIRNIQQSYIWTIDTIINDIYPLFDFCILANNSTIALCAVLIYWFITTGPLIKDKSIIMESLVNEPELIDIINYIDNNYIPTKSALD